MFCSNCGNQIADNTAVCPYCRYQLRRGTAVQTPAPRTALPGLALGFGITGAIFGYVGLIVHAVGRNAIGAILIVLAIFLGIGSVICGAIGLRCSIHTGGRKNVAGIILSAIGISGGAVAHVFAFFGLFLRSMIGRF